MSCKPLFRMLILAALALAVLPARAGLTDFSSWTLVRDPPNAHFTADASTTQILLSAAGGPVSGGTDIGYQSVDGHTPAASSSGYAFSPLFDFSLVIDFRVVFGTVPVGMLGIGFGIGEDGDGMNSAGVVVLTNNGTPLGFGVAGRVDDRDLTPLPIFLAASGGGALFLSYQAASGNVTLGASQTPGASAAAASASYSGIQHQWNRGDLLVSVFLRSDGTAWQGGTAQATFSNLRVLTGTPVAIPGPAPVALIALGLAGLIGRRGQAPARRLPAQLPHGQ